MDINSKNKKNNWNFDFDKFLSEEAKKLPRQQPTDELWFAIETKLMELKSKISIRERVINWYRKISIPKWQPAWKYAAVAASVAIIILIFWSKFIYEPDPLEVVAKAEQKYIKAIEKLEMVVEKSELDMDISLFALYQERLALLDESIATCKQTIQQNNENVNARKYLFLAYQEKVNTLKKIFDQQKGRL